MGSEMLPGLTVLTCCYNQEGYIRQTVESVLMQGTDFPVRLVVSDDASTDGTALILREYAARFPERMTVVSTGRNSGSFGNYLRALQELHTEFFTLLDGDDYWTDPDYLNDAVHFLLEHPRHTVYFQNVKWLRPNGTYQYQQPPDAVDFDMTFSDFTSGREVFPQTTGAVFRNVVFRDGIPDYLTRAVGTLQENSLKGDVFRFLQHLEFGDAHFHNRESGVYRLLESGVFGRTSSARRTIIQAQCFVDFYSRFKCELPFFATRTYKLFAEALEQFRDDVLNGCPVGEELMSRLASVSAFCAEHAREIHLESPGEKTKRLRDRMRLWLYSRLRKKLMRKGLA